MGGSGILEVCTGGGVGDKRGVGVTGVIGVVGAAGTDKFVRVSELWEMGGGGEMECLFRFIFGGRAGGDSVGEVAAKFGLLSDLSRGAQCVTE
jgi:hypothetical protein